MAGSARRRTWALASLVVATVVLGSVVMPLQAAPPKCFGRPATKVGTAEPDRLRGTDAPDVIAGLGGSDRISGLRGEDLICGGDGGDHIVANGGEASIDGGRGMDVITAGAGRTTIRGGPGIDIIFTNDGVGGTIAGGEGSDWLSFVDRSCRTAVTANLSSGVGSYRRCGDGTGTAEWDIGGVENLEGGLGSDALTGSDVANLLLGFESNDALIGRGGNDSIYGHTGSDLLAGGPGHDRAVGGSGSDRCRTAEIRSSC